MRGAHRGGGGAGQGPSRLSRSRTQRAPEVPRRGRKDRPGKRQCGEPAEEAEGLGKATSRLSRSRTRRAPVRCERRGRKGRSRKAPPTPGGRGCGVIMADGWHALRGEGSFPWSPPPRCVGGPGGGDIIMGGWWWIPRGEGPYVRGPPPRYAVRLGDAANGARRQKRAVGDDHFGRKAFSVARRLPQVYVKDRRRPPAKAPDLLQVPAAVVDGARASDPEAVRAQACGRNAARKGGTAKPLL